MKREQAFLDRAFAAHGHHLEDSLGGAVIGVLRASFALRDPYVVVLLSDDEVHVLSEQLRRSEHLAHRQRALYDERLVEAHDILHPRQLEEVVADGYLGGCVATGIEEHHMEQCRIEHDVAVVTDEGVAIAEVEVREVGIAAERSLSEQVLQELVAERFLKLEIGLALVHLLAYSLNGHTGIEVCQHLAELLVLYQTVEYLGELFRRKRTDRVVFVELFRCHDRSFEF